MDALSPWHLLILAAVFVLLFGSRKLPDAARSLGRSMRIFKAETAALRDGDESADGRQAQALQPQAAQPEAAQAQTVQPQQPSATQPAQAPATQPQQSPAGDGTIVNGVPLAEPRSNQPST